MKFDDLVARFPANALQPSITGAPRAALSVAPTILRGFVRPTLEVVEWPDDATVVLVEAAGAVGKSTAAEALAHELRWPLVLAQHAQVGSYSLTGLIHDSLGIDSDYLKDMVHGRAGVVVDSLDEAHFRAGTQNFLAFLENVQQVAGGPAAGGRAPSVILLSRSDTAEFVQLAFADKDLPLAVLRLSFFDRPGAESFVTSYLRRRFDESKQPEYNVALASPSPFKRLRDERFRQVLQVVAMDGQASLDTNWDKAADFLGYAPVLTALAESLAVLNPSAEYDKLKAARAENETQLLTEIVDRVLLREQAKFSEQLISKLRALLPASDANTIDADALYTPAEQAIRVHSYIHGNDLVSPPPTALPSSLRATYEEAADRFVADHPFVKGRSFASIVFADYVHAPTALGLDAATALAKPPDSDMTDVGAFFLAFVLRLHPNHPVPEALAESLLRSWYQERDLQVPRVALAHAQLLLPSDEDGMLSFVEVADGDSPREPHVRTFAVTEQSGAMHLFGPLKNVAVISESGIVLGRRAEHLNLGPDVVIACQDVQIETETLNVGWRNEESGVVISGQDITANHVTQIVGSQESLVLFSANPIPGRLQAHHRDLPSHGAHTIPYEDFIGLRAILTSFFNSVHKGLSANRERLAHDVVSRSDVRERILAHLITSGVVSVDGEWYCLDTAALGQVGFSLQDLKHGVPTDAILQFLAAARYHSS